MKLSKGERQEPSRRVDDDVRRLKAIRLEMSMYNCQIVIIVMSMFLTVIGVVMICGGVITSIEKKDLVAILFHTATFPQSISLMFILLGLLVLFLGILGFRVGSHLSGPLITMVTGMVILTTIVTFSLIFLLGIDGSNIRAESLRNFLHILKDYREDKSFKYRDEVDTVQESWKCCGQLSPSNWLCLNTEWKKSRSASSSHIAPESCCVHRKKDCNSSVGHLFKRGCYDLVVSWLSRMNTLLMVFLVVLFSLSAVKMVTLVYTLYLLFKKKEFYEETKSIEREVIRRRQMERVMAEKLGSKSKSLPEQINRI